MSHHPHLFTPDPLTWLLQGGEQYQSAFYVYEELASAPGTSAALSIVGQAVAELHLGRLPEAESALSTALEKYPEDVQVIANSIVLNVLAGKSVEELESYVCLCLGWMHTNILVLGVCKSPCLHTLFYRMWLRRAISLIPLLRSIPPEWLPRLFGSGLVYGEVRMVVYELYGLAFRVLIDHSIYSDLLIVLYPLLDALYSLYTLDNYLYTQPNPICTYNLAAIHPFKSLPCCDSCPINPAL